VFGRSGTTSRAHPNLLHVERSLSSMPDSPSFVLSGASARALRDEVNGYPIQLAKVQPPPLRDETLARDRLLDWLHTKIHDRVVLVIAEAGYGKTTLLADFSRRTRIRTLWYRLDEGDRGWIPFLSHLVAAGREHDRSFAPATNDLLHDLGPTEPPRESVLETFLRELPSIADGGAALILDDFHLVDETDDVREIVRELIARAPERVSIVISSRRPPALPVARLRAQGEVAELTTEDLRFDRVETERLFRDAYAHPLEPDVLADLSSRTEGWAASLQLVNAALRGRSAAAARSFVHNLSGAEGDLYDYLAEEVVGDLRPEMQMFLMRSSILETIDPDLAAIASDVDVPTVRTLIEEAEKVGLLTRRGGLTRSASRFHPLVRDFLLERLNAELGPASVREMHRKVATSASDDDWELACRHFTAAGDLQEANSVLRESLPRIMATGQYVTAARYLGRGPFEPDQPTFNVILSRDAFSRGEFALALQHARRALENDSSWEPALANLVSLLVSSNRPEEAVEIAGRVLSSGLDPQLRAIAAASIACMEASVDGDLMATLHQLRALAAQSHEQGHRHYEAISHLNSANLLRALGDGAGALSEAVEALGTLEESLTEEVAVAHAVRGWALAQEGRLDEARFSLLDARMAAGGRSKSMREVLAEFAWTETWMGDDAVASRLLDEARQLPDDEYNHEADYLHLASAQLALRLGDVATAKSFLGYVVPRTLSPIAGREAWRLSLEAHSRVLAGTPDSQDSVDTALSQSIRQRSPLWIDYNSLLAALQKSATRFDQQVALLAENNPTVLSMLAELVSQRLGDLLAPTVASIQAEGKRRPARWRDALRVVVDSPKHESRLPAARILDAIGTIDDVRRLRGVARTNQGHRADSGLGRSLSRRLAERIFVEDQGRIVLRIGDTQIRGTEIRRKVLALLCYLLSRSDFSAARDEVLEALWPDADPVVALNSLNQTIYFLRRIFEPVYREELSPGYVHHDAELLWLDAELVDSRSAKCRRLIAASSKPPTPHDVHQLMMEYRGRFALDFAYEDWAAERCSGSSAKLPCGCATCLANGAGLPAARRGLVGDGAVRTAAVHDPDRVSPLRRDARDVHPDDWGLGWRRRQARSIHEPAQPAREANRGRHWPPDAGERRRSGGARVGRPAP